MKNEMTITTEQFIEFNKNSVKQKLNRTFYTSKMLKAGSMKKGACYEFHYMMFHVNMFGKHSQRVLVVLENTLAIFDITLEDYDKLMPMKMAS